MPVPYKISAGVLLAVTVMGAGALAQRNDAANPEITVTLLGSGGGPNPNPKRFGPSILVEAGGQTLLFDCGRGASIRLAQLGIRLGQVRNVFLTHLHSDHIIGLPDLYLTGWGAQGRRTPLRVWGPAGTKEMMAHLVKAFDFDIRIRRDVDEKFVKEGIEVSSTDIKEGVIFEEGGVAVTAFYVDHRPIEPAFGYRVDYRGRSVAMSGDTRFSENLIKHAKGVDLLIHEAIDPLEVRARLSRLAATQAEIDNIVAHHITAEEAGVVFARVKPKLAVYAHISDADLITPARKSYSGPLEAGEDLMAIDIGSNVTVRRANK
ncbi:MAG TPA: MBL fold metallo-hydrolase [Vicinamibacterales bacterium]|nr:MBL fold metallo-hydrolase [Vicinamibacterales bacterium]